MLSVDAASSGRQMICVACGGTVTVPPAVQEIPPAINADEKLFCSKCGAQNRRRDVRCAACSAPLHAAPSSRQVAVEDNTMGGLIPFKNAQALWAYYLGIFSLIPCIGIPLGIAALILGLRGLKFAEAHPEARGKGHSWAGIIIGSLSALGYTLLIVIPVLIAVSKK